MKDGKNIWDVLKVIYFCLLCLPGLIGLIMIASGNGTSSKKTTPPKNTYQNTVKPIQNYISPINSPTGIQRMNDVQENYYSQPSRRSSSGAPTPDDAYDEGYENGYEQGYYDGLNGYSYGFNYDDDTHYYNIYETKYQDGYEEGYEEGYNDGQNDYEEDDDRW